MPECWLTQGLNLDCRTSAGGLKSLLLIEFDNVTAMTLTSNVVTAITKASGKTFKKYNLIAFTGDAKVEGTHSRPNGTNAYKHTVSFPINKMSTSVRSEINLLVQNRLLVIGQDNNGTYWLFGKDNGMMVATSSSAMGVALSDRNGYNLVLESDEFQPEIEVQASIIAGLLS